MIYFTNIEPLAILVIYMNFVGVEFNYKTTAWFHCKLVTREPKGLILRMLIWLKPEKV